MVSVLKKKKVCYISTNYLTMLPKWLEEGLWEQEMSSLAFRFSSHQPQSHRGPSGPDFAWGSMSSTGLPCAPDWDIGDAGIGSWRLWFSRLTLDPGICLLNRLSRWSWSRQHTDHSGRTLALNYPQSPCVSCDSIARFQTQYDSIGAVSNKWMRWARLHEEVGLGAELCPPKRYVTV